MDPMTDEQRYAAILSRDARFDGVFFTCVQSTGIFCRPSCPSRTPRRDRVVFAASAAAAADAGFRACRRCGPAAPPGSPDHRPAGTLAARALDLIEAGELDHGSVPDLARRLAVSERTLHRALLQETGAGALAHARVHRARRAHELLRGTDLPVAEIAYAAGFGSERQFHDTIRRIYGQSPTDVRLARPGGKTTGASAPAGPGEAGAAHLSARLRVREPFDGLGLADWFSERAVPGVEEVDGLHWLRALHLP
ncbi:MAG: Ada metal-binding domain-containing protein, partial [Brachybacterium sp.]|nr:Ada metal-binding domain-containing protein [Brachybacterium sp.]